MDNSQLNSIITKYQTKMQMLVNNSANKTIYKNNNKTKLDKQTEIKHTIAKTS